MKKKHIIIFLVLMTLLLSACNSLSSVIAAEESGLPSWMVRTPQRRGMTAFTASAEGVNDDQAFNAAVSALLEEVSSYLGYDVAGRYYRELTLFSSVSELGLEIAEQLYTGGSCYLLAYADTSVLDSMRSDEYRAVLDRETRIAALLDQAMAYYRDNNDVDAISCCLEAIAVSTSGDIFTEEYSAERILERAMDWLSNIRITVSRISESTGEATVRVRRNRGFFSPAVSNAPIEAIFPVRKSDGSIAPYTVPLKTGSDGRVRFGGFYPPMSNEGTVIFSLDLSSQLQEASVNTPEGFFDEFESVLGGVSASFSYSIVSQKADDGIVVVFDEYSARGEVLSSSYARSAFVSFLSSENIEVTVAEGNYDELSEAVEDIQNRYPEMRYLVWGRTGVTGEDITPEGRTVRVSGGYTVLVDLLDGSIIADDSITQSVTWSEEEIDSSLSDIFTRYGKAVASYLVQYL